MKKFVVCCLLMVAGLVAGQNFENFKDNNGVLEYEKIVDIPKSKDSIFNLTKEWISLNYNDSNKVVKLSNQNKIIVKGLQDIRYIINNVSISANLDYSLVISFKENKYRFEIIDMIVSITETQQRTRIYDYRKTLETNLEQYKDMLIEQMNNAEGKAVKKYYEKLIKNEKELKKQLELLRDTSILLMQKIEKFCADTENSLQQYIIKTGDSDGDW